MRGSRGVLHNLGVLTVAQASAQLLNLVALVYLARYLGDRWFGVVQVGVAVSAYAMITAEWGLMSLGIREIARIDRPDQVREYARCHQGLLAVLAVVVLAAGFLLLPLFPFFAEDKAVFLLYLALVLPQIWNQEWIAIGLERMGWVGAARAAGSLVYAGLVLGLLRHLDGVGQWPAWRWVPALYLLSFFLGNLVLVFPVRRWLGGLVFPVWSGTGDWSRRLGQTGPIGASIVTMRVLMNGDLILLGILARPEVAGRYAAAAKVGFLLIIAMEVLWKALLPRLSRLAKGPRSEFLSRFQLYFGLVAGGVLPVAVGGLFAGPDLMHLVYGEAYAGVGPIFQVLAFSYTLLALGWFLGNTLLAADRQKEFFPPLLLSAAVAVGAVWLLVPRWQGLGAALGMLVSHSLLLVLLVIICRRWFGPPLLGAAVAVTGGLAAMSVVLWQLGGVPVVPRVLIAGIVYLGTAGWPLKRWALRLLA